jgi:hypothetical protein
MKQFLRYPDMDADMKIYIFHLLLTDPALNDLVPERRNEILQLCTYCLENNIRGRAANSLYHYFWLQCTEMNIDVNPYAAQVEKILFDDLTRFSVTAKPHSQVRYVYISEPEKKGLDLYEIDPATQSAVVEAADTRFIYTCLNMGRKNIIDEPLTVKRMVARAEPALFKYFFRQGARSFYLLAYLANHWLTRLAETDEWDSPEVLAEEAIPVFEALLTHKKTARPYGMRLRVALGGLCYRAGRFDLALEYYGEVDENELEKLATAEVSVRDGEERGEMHARSGEMHARGGEMHARGREVHSRSGEIHSASMEHILNVFLQTHEYARAAGLIMRKKKYISNKVLFNAVKKLSGPDYAAHHMDLADAAYDLLLDAWYDADLLRIVLSHYSGGQSEWQELSRALGALNITAPGLDEIIVKNSIWMHQFDEDAQKAFVRLVNETGSDEYHPPLLNAFIEYASYEMMLNNARPDYETLTLLEKMFLNSQANNPLLAWALCHVYLTYSITTFYSEQVLEAAVRSQEEKGFLFPVFREYWDKRNKHPFLEKNQPFLYRSLPDKNVWLHYRIDDTPAFQAVPMRYLCFGLYLAILPLFYKETLTYYFSEELATGSITTREQTITNDSAYLCEPNEAEDLFFTVNNAIIYEQMFKYEQVERIITGLVRDVKRVRSGLM